MGRVTRVLCLALAVVASFVVPAAAQNIPTLARSFLMDVVVDLIVDGRPMIIERTVRCDGYTLPNGQGFWARSPHAFGERLSAGGGLAVVTPAVRHRMVSLAIGSEGR